MENNNDVKTENDVQKESCAEKETSAKKTNGKRRTIVSIILIVVCALSLALGLTLWLTDCFKSCGDDTPPAPIDYAGQVKLDMTSETLKAEVEVVNYIDGDTTHFTAPDGFTGKTTSGYMKARYIAVNTPESTGKIEEWGKKASNYTKTALKSATSIIIETDGTTWDADSTGERYLVWVWYKTAESGEYRNLNLELLQNGLAVGSKASSTRYGEIAVSAIDQATQLELHVHSSEKDPDYFYGKASELDLRELRLNIDDYVGQRVAFEGTVTQYSAAQGVYVEDYDEESDMSFGVYVYYGFFLSSSGEDVLVKGNRVRVVGIVEYWATGGTYQVVDLKYDPFEVDDPDNLQLIEEDVEVVHTLTSAETFLGKKSVTTTNDEGEETIESYDFAKLALNTAVAMENLVVERVKTTNNDGDNDGAMTLTCKQGNKTVTIRTIKLYHENNTLMTQDELLGKTINVKGIVDFFKGDYQIKVFDIKDITILN